MPGIFNRRSFKQIQKIKDMKIEFIKKTEKLTGNIRYYILVDGEPASLNYIDKTEARKIYQSICEKYLKYPSDKTEVLEQTNIVTS